MNKFAIPALAAAIALGACAEANAPADDGADGTDTTTVVTEPAPAETVIVDPVEGDEGSSLTIDGKDVDATISEDGVEAKVDVD